MGAEGPDGSMLEAQRAAALHEAHFDAQEEELIFAAAQDGALQALKRSAPITETKIADAVALGVTRALAVWTTLFVELESVETPEAAAPWEGEHL